MLWTIVVVLVVLWLIGWSFHVAGPLIHGFLIVALALAIFNIATRSKTI